MIVAAFILAVLAFIMGGVALVGYLTHINGTRPHVHNGRFLP